MPGARSARLGGLGAAVAACVAVLALVTSGAAAATPAYCTAAHIPNVSPDPLLGSGKILENNLTLTPGAPGVIGVTTKSGTTGTVLNPVTGNAFQIAYIEETEIYEFLNNAGTASKPLSPGASDSGKATLKSLPSGTVNHLTNPPAPSSGAGLPYAVILSSNLKTIIAQVPVNIVDQNYKPNTTAWMHATTGSQAQPKPTTCGSGDNLYSLLRFSSQGVHGLTPGVTYAAFLRVRDTDQSGPLSNHLWYFTPPPKAQPTITTHAAPNNVFLTQSLQDTATVSGGQSPTGKVTFTLYGPNDNTCTTAVKTVTVPLDPQTGTASSGPIAPQAPGLYRWRATYSGDDNNNGAGPTDCLDGDENATVKPLPVKAFVAYADIARTTTSTGGAPNPWQGSANTTFVGCGSTLISGFPSSPCPTTTISGKRVVRYDAGALRFDVTAGTIPLTFTDASVSIGPRCTGDFVYRPWPGLNTTIQPGGTLILTQTGGNAANTCQTDDPNFDTSESALPALSPSSPNCAPNGAQPVITVTINGVVVSFTDTGQVLNTGGFDLHNCKGLTEFKDWVALN